MRKIIILLIVYYQCVYIGPCSRYVYAFDYNVLIPDDVSFSRSRRTPKVKGCYKDFEYRLELQNRHYRMYGLFEQVNNRKYDGGGALLSPLSFFEIEWYKRDVYNLDNFTARLLCIIYDNRDSKNKILKHTGALKLGGAYSLDYWKNPVGLFSMNFLGRKNIYRWESNFKDTVKINISTGFIIPFKKLVKVDGFYYSPNYEKQSVNDNVFEWDKDILGWRKGK